MRQRRARIPGVLGALLVCLCSTLAQAQSATEDWSLFEPERRHALTLRLGEGDTTAWGGGAVLMLPAAFELQADLFRSKVQTVSESDRLTDLSLTLTTDPTRAWSGELVYQSSGSADSLESEDVGLGVYRTGAHWQLGFRYLVGEVTLRAEPLGQNRRPSRGQTDRTAWQLRGAVFTDRWLWSASYLDYRYEADLGTQSNLALLRRLGFNTFQQVFGLLDWTATVDVGLQQARHGWWLGYTESALLLTGDSLSIPFAEWSYALSERWTVAVLGAMGLNDAEDYLELSLRVEL